MMYVVNYSGVVDSVSGGVTNLNKLREGLRRENMYIYIYREREREREREKRGYGAAVAKMLTGRCFCCDCMKTFLATSKNISFISSSESVRCCTRQLV